MNLNQIDPKNFIMALFKRDDGERFLLGMGLYEFKDGLQHFQPNIIANDIVEKQGANGQLLAGQVMRTGTQSFDGYIGDETTTRVDTENARRAFVRFFQPNFFYKVIYIMPNGTAIQRQNGYLVDAPSVPEMIERFPEYHVALAFENLNYYTYNEDASGNETYAQEVTIEPEGLLTGGLIWDAIGAEWEGFTKSTYTGTIISQNAIKGPLDLDKIAGDTSQNGTPTPDSPKAVQTVTGSQIVTITGQNLYNVNNTTTVGAGVTVDSDGWITIAYSGATYVNYYTGLLNVAPNTSYAIVTEIKSVTGGGQLNVTSKGDVNPQQFNERVFWEFGNLSAEDVKVTTITTKADVTSGTIGVRSYAYFASGNTGTITFRISILADTSVTPSTFTYEPYTSTTYQLDLGTIELCKLGTYQDYIWNDGGTWKLHKETNSKDISGSTGWYSSGQAFKNLFSRTAIDDIALTYSSSSVLIPALCPALKREYQTPLYNGTSNGFSFRTDGAGGLSNSTNGILVRQADKWGSLSNFTTWLSQNSLVFYYVLATPTDTAITNATLIKQLNAINNAEAKSGTNNIMVTATGTNLAGPVTIELPVSGGGAIWDAESGHATTTFTVDGLMPVAPIWTVVGPAESPIIENITDGTSLSFIGQIPAGQSLVVDCDAQTAVMGGANVKNNIHGTWQSFSPGNVTIRYSGANVTDPCTLKWNEVVE